MLQPAKHVRLRTGGDCMLHASRYESSTKHGLSQFSALSASNLFLTSINKWRRDRVRCILHNVLPAVHNKINDKGEALPASVSFIRMTVSLVGSNRYTSPQRVTSATRCDLVDLPFSEHNFSFISGSRCFAEPYAERILLA